jgi:hypothetical protein
VYSACSSIYTFWEVLRWLRCHWIGLNSRLRKIGKTEFEIEALVWKSIYIARLPWLAFEALRLLGK